MVQVLLILTLGIVIIIVIQCIVAAVMIHLVIAISNTILYIEK